MTKRNLSILLSLFLALISHTLIAQTDVETFTIENVRVHKVQSEIVPNQIYEIRVGLPGSYQSSPDKEYPLIVVLDGQWNFMLASDIASKLAYDGMIPEAITVGITWGGEGDDPNVLRFRDFVRPETPYLPMSGGASLFLSSLTDELIPSVESLYRVGDKRVLLGASLGGLFTSYAMLENPGFFNGYVAIAGSYFADGAYLDEKLELMHRSEALKNVRSFLSVGSLDSNQAHVEKFIESVRSAKLKGLKSKYKVFHGVGHAGVEPIAYTYGLQYVFQRPSLKLSAEILQQYIGEYEGGVEGYPPFPITVSIADSGKLAIGDANQFNEYLAESETKFYLEGVNVSVEFADADRFTINSQGTFLQFSRVVQ